MSTTYRSLASHQFKLHSSPIQALTHTERRVPRIEVNSHNHFDYFDHFEMIFYNRYCNDRFFRNFNTLIEIDSCRYQIYRHDLFYRVFYNFFVTIIASIIILNCALRRVKIESIDSIVELKSILLNVFERVRLFNLLDMIRYRFDFFRQTNNLFQLDSKHNDINSTSYRDLQIKMQNFHQIEVLLIIRQFF
jgi:hypothetical protein